MSDWQFSAHALDRALDMALDPEELRRAIHHPEVIRPHPQDTEQVIHVSGRIAIAVNATVKRVITVMWIAQFRSGDTKRRKTAKDEEEFFRDN